MNRVSYRAWFAMLAAVAATESVMVWFTLTH